MPISETVNRMTLAPGVVEVNHLHASIVYSGRQLGNVDPRFGEVPDVEANRQKLIQSLNAERYIVQKPLCDSEFLDLSSIPTDDLEDEYPTDGLFVNHPGIVLGLNTADCIAMALYGKKSPALGVIHAGRAGVDGGIHQASVQHLIEVHETPVEDVRAYFGPAIKQDSYYYPEISAEQLADPKWKRFIDPHGGNYHIDLVGRVVKDLVELGLEPSQIEVNPIDVGADSRYFSHTRNSRTGEPEGRNGFAAMLRPNL